MLKERRTEAISFFAYFALIRVRKCEYPVVNRITNSLLQGEAPKKFKKWMKWDNGSKSLGEQFSEIFLKFVAT